MAATRVIIQINKLASRKGTKPCGRAPDCLDRYQHDLLNHAHSAYHQANNMLIR